MATQFDIAAWKRNDRAAAGSPSISHATRLTCWTRTSIRAPAGQQYLYGDTSGLLPFTPPRLPLDLNAGFPQQFIKKGTSEESVGVEHIVQGAVAAHVAWPPNGVCSFRNNLNKIAGTLLPGSDAWVIDATLLPHLPHSSSSDATDAAGDIGGSGGNHGSSRGVLFLDIVKTPEKSFPGAEKFMYYGYKFESACTGGSGGPEDVVDSTSEFSAVMCLQLGQHYVVMAAEMDAYDPAGSGAADVSAAGVLPSYVEMKTYNVPTKPHAWANFYAKYAKWWIQSFLGGVPTLVLGGRDNRGFLTEVKRVPVHSLPTSAAAAGHPFNCWQLMRFTDQVLAWMRSCCAAAPGQQLRFEYTPESGSIACYSVDGDLHRRVVDALGTGNDHF